MDRQEDGEKKSRRQETQNCTQKWCEAAMVQRADEQRSHSAPLGVYHLVLFVHLSVYITLRLCWPLNCLQPVLLTDWVLFTVCHLFLNIYLYLLYFFLSLSPFYQCPIKNILLLPGSLLFLFYAFLWLIRRPRADFNYNCGFAAIIYKVWLTQTDQKHFFSCVH